MRRTLAVAAAALTWCTAIAADTAFDVTAYLQVKVSQFERCIGDGLRALPARSSEVQTVEVVASCMEPVFDVCANRFALRSDAEVACYRAEEAYWKEVGRVKWRRRGETDGQSEQQWKSIVAQCADFDQRSGPWCRSLLYNRLSLEVIADRVIEEVANE